MRIKDKKVEINTYAQQEASSLAGCWKSPPASQAAAREARDMRERRIRISKFRKPRTSDLESSLVPPVSHLSRGYPAGVFSSCPRRAGHRRFGLPKWFFRSLLGRKSVFQFSSRRPH
jgi:hypothetical protein